MFEFDYINYLSEFDDIVIHISYPGENSDKIGKLEVINPLFERFVFDYKENDVIYLKKVNLKLTKLCRIFAKFYVLEYNYRISLPFASFPKKSFATFSLLYRINLF